eukprot:1041755-Pyramimonas_sp.AAC.1
MSKPSRAKRGRSFEALSPQRSGRRFSYTCAGRPAPTRAAGRTTSTVTRTVRAVEGPIGRPSVTA